MAKRIILNPNGNFLLGDGSDYCESLRPNRKTICQKKKGHKGSCRAVIFWEKED